MVRELYIHEINVPDASARVEIDANVPVFLLTFTACATYLFGGPLVAIRGPYEQRHIVLEPKQSGSWYLAGSSPGNGKYRLVLSERTTDWDEFYLKVCGFG